MGSSFGLLMSVLASQKSWTEGGAFISFEQHRGPFVTAQEGVRLVSWVSAQGATSKT